MCDTDYLVLAGRVTKAYWYAAYVREVLGNEGSGEPQYNIEWEVQDELVASSTRQIVGDLVTDGGHGRAGDMQWVSRRMECDGFVAAMLRLTADNQDEHDQEIICSTCPANGPLQSADSYWSCEEPECDGFNLCEECYTTDPGYQTHHDGSHRFNTHLIEGITHV